mmetsp:Transcript_24122/g.38766  ORF Transcript_24122/g.38766 Transcript_24122/m.38766 type:complete len:163 (+) Transcript_24122:1966-2454(+)
MNMRLFIPNILFSLQFSRDERFLHHTRYGQPNIEAEGIENFGNTKEPVSTLSSSLSPPTFFSCSIANGSGYERFIAGLVIQIALSWFSMRSKPDFVAIDEGFGCLDSENLSRVGVIFDYLRQQYRYLIIITHIDAIKDDIDIGIDIQIDKMSGDSFIKYVSP